MRMLSLVAAVLAQAGSVALAQPAELAQVNDLAGAWYCTGKGVNPMDGKEVTYRSTMRGKWDLNRFWLGFVYAQKKSKTNPTAFTGKGFIGFDSASKRFAFFGADDAGGWINLGSPGWAGNAMVFEGVGAGGGQNMKMRFTFTKGATERQMTFKTEMQMAKEFTTLGEDTCKR